MIKFLDASEVDQFITIRGKSIREEVFSIGSDLNAVIDRARTLKDFNSKSPSNFVLGKFESDQSPRKAAMPGTYVDEIFMEWICKL